MADTNKINVVVKTSSGAKYDISTQTDITVEEFKKLLEQQSQIPAEQQRLIYSGHVLRNEQKLSDFDIKDGHTMHLVRSARTAPSQPGPSTASPTSSTSTQPTPGATGTNTAQQPNPFGNLFGSMNTGQAQPGAQPNPFANLMGGFGGGMPGGMPGGMGGGMPGMPPMDFNTIAQMMQNPFVQNMMQQMMSNPALLQQMLANNPFAQQMMNNNPMMRDMMNNPEVLRQLTDPATMQNLAQMQQALGQLQGFGGQGGGFGGLGGFGQPTQPQTSQPQPGTAPQQPTGANPAVNPFAQLFGGMGMPQAPQQQAPQEPPEVRFAVQLRQLNDMGFTNYEANIAALQATMGNVQLAIERLLGNM